LSTSLTWQPQSGAVHRAKRMRMYYPWWIGTLLSIGIRITLLLIGTF
jgi:hypothetical protein